jgi:hypothetical protein
MAAAHGGGNVGRQRRPRLQADGRAWPRVAAAPVSRRPRGRTADLYFSTVFG